VNQCQPISNIDFVGLTRLFNAMHLTIAVIEKLFKQEKLANGVALILIN